MERGTYLPLPVSVKNVSKEPASPMFLASGSSRPSALRPCSRRYLDNRVSWLYDPEGLVEFPSIRWNGGVGEGGLTIPMRCFQAGCQPGQCEDGTPGKNKTSIILPHKIGCDRIHDASSNGAPTRRVGEAWTASVGSTYLPTHDDRRALSTMRYVAM